VIAGPQDIDRTGSRRESFAGRWIIAVTLGEATGFAVAAGIAVFTIVLQIDGAVRLVLVVAGGAIEGAALASGQYLAMARNRPRAWLWIGATAVAASVAWLLGMLPSTLRLELGSIGAIVLAVLGGMLLLATIPLAQWLVMRRRGTFRWIPVNMGAWLAAVLWTAAPSPLVDERSPIPLVASLYLMAGLLMAVTVAVLTAPVARSLFSDRITGPLRGSRATRRSAPPARA
jgi:hypothetical protein